MCIINNRKQPDQRLKIIEKKENAHAVKENKEDIGELKEKVADLRKENISRSRYKRRWDLRLIGLLEKEDEDTREMVIGILPGDSVISGEVSAVGGYRASSIGKRNDAATNKLPRPVIIQIVMRTV
ncbi:zinc finger 2-like protein [Labeo rohita]|uniref:Zinc finger 2-like protein n=1 Tax=Labeo rohita TaxID=84645 RepID=A0A498NVW4_LABRO|nr:zinc finger 2-like protein [Labeo rohita]